MTVVSSTGAPLPRAMTPCTSLAIPGVPSCQVPMSIEGESTAAAEQRQPERSQLASRKAADEHRVGVHDFQGGVLVVSLEDGDAGIDPAERGSGHHEYAVGE